MIPPKLERQSHESSEEQKQVEGGQSQDKEAYGPGLCGGVPAPTPLIRVFGGGVVDGGAGEAAEVKQELIEGDEKAKNAVLRAGQIGPVGFVEIDFARRLFVYGRAFGF